MIAINIFKNITCDNIVAIIKYMNTRVFWGEVDRFVKSNQPSAIKYQLKIESINGILNEGAHKPPG